LDNDQIEAEADIDYHVTLKADEILALMDQLTPIQRLVFNMHKIEGYHHDEIAGMLHIAPGTSRSHMSRAVKKLAALFLAGQNERRHEAI
jgi:RNA polymerase sigma-70 factor (ECF subfamily)